MSGILSENECYTGRLVITQLARFCNAIPSKTIPRMPNIITTSTNIIAIIIIALVNKEMCNSILIQVHAIGKDGRDFFGGTSQIQCPPKLAAK